MKKSFIFIALILLLSFVACLTACGPNDDNKEPVENANSNGVPIYTGMTLVQAPRMLLPRTVASVDEDIDDEDTNDDFDFQSDDDIIPNEEVYISIHFNNAKRYEILSFTFNGMKYSSYMFEKGSNMENIIIKVKANDFSYDEGEVQFTIDAIKYVDGTEIKDVIIGGDQTLRLLIRYSIHYNDAEKVGINPLSYNKKSETITLVEDSKVGYEFLGWYDANNEYANKVTTIEKGTIGELNLYAKWEIISYNIRYHLNGGDMSEDCPDTYTVESGRFLRTPLPTKEDHIFLGWYKDPNFSEELTEFSIGDLELYAKWTTYGALDLEFTKCHAGEIFDEDIIGDIDEFYYVSRFYGFNSQKVIIPSEWEGLPVLAIGDEAFGDSWKCGKLTEIIIPSSVKIIGARAFIGCPQLKDVTLSEGLQFIDIQAFGFCTELKEITIPNSVQTMVGWTFYGCTGLNKIILHDNIQTIGDGAFGGCSGLSEITLPDSIKIIGKSAFSGCSGLSEMTIPGSVQTIGDGAFEGCCGLSEITIPNNVQTIGERTFYDCTGLNKIILSDGLQAIENETFRNCTELTTITIPDSVQTIGECAFYGCSVLTEITIPSTVQTIGEYAFYDCTGLKNITIPGSVQTIEEYAFYGCTGLKNITIPGSVQTIEEYAFRDCTGLENVTLNNGLQTIEEYAFDGCSGLIEITLPGSVQTIEEYAFRDCTGLENVTLNNGLQTIGDSAFEGCSGLIEIIIPSSVQTIGERAFEDCRRLSKITIPSSVQKIGRLAFNGCNALSEAEFAEPDGWTCGEIIITGLDDRATAAEYLKDVYSEYVWERK